MLKEALKHFEEMRTKYSKTGMLYVCLNQSIPQNDFNTQRFFSAFIF